MQLFLGRKKRKPDFPKEIVLQTDGVCSKCICRYNVRMFKGEKAIWAGPGTGCIWHEQCPDGCEAYGSGEPEFMCNGCAYAYEEFAAYAAEKGWAIH